MLKFKLSGFFYGMGTAIVFISLIYYIVYNYDIRNKLTATSLSEDQIIELARDIGMVFPSELE